MDAPLALIYSYVSNEEEEDGRGRFKAEIRHFPGYHKDDDDENQREDKNGPNERTKGGTEGRLPFARERSGGGGGSGEISWSTRLESPGRVRSQSSLRRFRSICQAKWA